MSDGPDSVRSQWKCPNLLLIGSDEKVDTRLLHTGRVASLSLSRSQRRLLNFPDATRDACSVKASGWGPPTQVVSVSPV